MKGTKPVGDQPPIGSRVRLIGGPTRIGFLAEGEKIRVDRVWVKVKFPDQTQWVPRDQLEPVPAEPESPIDLLESGRLGHSSDLRRTLAHMRLTGRLADIIYSMEATNTDFYAYQFKPVLRFLNSPSNALLIADEVGLGKTIEAGLIWTELRYRYELRRLLVLCPAMLQEKWQRELSHKIGVEAHIVKATQLLRRLREQRLSASGFALICSLQGARPPQGWSQGDNVRSGPAELARFLQESENKETLVDLVVIDEAHHLRNPESQTNELGHLFRPVTENLVLLTATPIHNYNQDLFSLLQLLDGDTFQRPEDLTAILNACAPLVEARNEMLSRSPSRAALLRALDQSEHNPLLEGNRQLALVREHVEREGWLSDRDRRAELATRLEMVNPLAYVMSRTRKRDVKEWRVEREPVPERISMAPCEERFYNAVTEFVISYAMTRVVNERFILATPQRQMSSCMPAALRWWLRRGNHLDKEAMDLVPETYRDKEAELGPLVRQLAAQARGFGDLDELTRNDSKYGRMREILRGFFRDNLQEKVVVFSTFRETLAYLSERLRQDGITNVVMHGGVREPKDDIIHRFQTDTDIRVLLSSEVGSEGIDLQFCRILINYDLPWNPMRIEQRIGRLDRLGQEAKKITIWNLLYAKTIDDRIYTRLYEKLDLCRQALGDFEAVLGDEIRKLTVDLLSDHLTPDQQKDRIDQTEQVLANRRQDEERLENEAAHLVAYGDYILSQVHAARDMNRWITGEDLRTYVIEFFNMHYPGCTFRQIEAGRLDYDIRLTSEAAHDLEDYVRRSHLDSSTRLIQGSYRTVLCRFENRTTAEDGGRIDLISQFHPLVRFVSAQISEREEQLTPAVAVKLSAKDVGTQHFPPGDYILAGVRWSVQGLQAVEKLLFAAARIDDPLELLSREHAEQLANLCARYGTDWFEAGVCLDLERITSIADEKLFASLDKEFEEFVEDARRRNEDRADLQLRNLERHLDNQHDKLGRIRQGHIAAGRKSLAKATEGRIEALEGRIERQRLKIENSRNVKHRRDEILIALVRVDDNTLGGE